MEAARTELELYTSRGISIITWMEVIAGAAREVESATRTFLTTFPTFPITSDIANRAVLLRRDFRIKIPDAIILATAQGDNRLLITRNTKDFSDGEPGIRIPYRI